MMEKIDINKYEFSSFRLNLQFQVVEKNEPAFYNFSKVKLGKSFLTYLNETDKKAVKALSSGENVMITIEYASLYSAIVYFTGEEYIVRTNTLALGIRKRLESLEDYKDINLGFIDAVSDDPKKLEDVKIDYRFKKAIYIEQRINDYINYVINPQSNRKQSYDIGGNIKLITLVSNYALKNCHANVTTDTEPFKYYALICPKDFDYMIFSCITLCFYLSKERNVDIKVKRFGDKIKVIFHFSDFRSEQTVEQLEACLKVNDFVSQNGEMSFLMMYLKTLCDLQGVGLEMNRMINPNREIITLEFDYFEEDDNSVELSSGTAAPDKVRSAEKALSPLLIYFSEQE